MLPLMKKIKELDITITLLNRLTSNGTLVTLEDVILQANIERHLQLRILEYLTNCNYSEKVSNAYKITFEGEYLIDKTIFPFKNRPFLAEKMYKQIKFIALLSNTLLVLFLGVLNYQINKEGERLNKEKEIQNAKTEIQIDKENDGGKIKNDSASIQPK
jgi:hypothetical protein